MMASMTGPAAGWFLGCSAGLGVSRRGCCGASAGLFCGVSGTSSNGLAGFFSCEGAGCCGADCGGAGCCAAAGYCALMGAATQRQRNAMDRHACLCLFIKHYLFTLRFYGDVYFRETVSLGQWQVAD